MGQSNQSRSCAEGVVMMRLGPRLMGQMASQGRTVRIKTDKWLIWKLWLCDKIGSIPLP